MYYIYEMRHTPTNMVYIGRRRLPNGETPETDKYYGSGKIWKQIYKRHPEECVKTVLEFARTKKEADELEREYIALYKELYGDKCVNITCGGGGVETHSDTTKQKISQNSKGQTPWNKGKKCPQISERQRGEKHPFFGKHRSEETRKKISLANTGRQFSEASRKKMSEAHMGQTSWNKGKHLSEATRKKISLSLTGKHPSEATRKKMSESKRGEKHHNFGKHSTQGWERDERGRFVKGCGKKGNS